MKNPVTIFGIILSACVWHEPVPPVCSHKESLAETLEISITIRGDGHRNTSMLSDEVLTACNMWEEVGVTCVMANSAESADLIVGFYIDNSCNKAGFVGSLGGITGIWINDQTSCRPSEEFSPWLTHLVAHEFGHLFGVDDIPIFCGAGIMGPAVERYQPTTLLSALTEGDIKSFNERNHSAFLDGNAVLDCGDDTVPENIPAHNSVPCAESVSTEVKVLRLWLEQDVAPYKREIMGGCYYWTPVNVSCASAPSPEEADVIVQAYPSEYGCGIAGYTYINQNDKYIFELNTSCLPEDAERAKTKVRAISAHELGHTLGIIHVPAFCGAAVMNPLLTRRTCISDTDVSAWQERYEE